MFKATKFLCKSRAVHNKEKREREEKKPPRVDERFGRERDMGEREVYILSFLFVTRNALSRNVIVRDP